MKQTEHFYFNYFYYNSLLRKHPLLSGNISLHTSQRLLGPRLLPIVLKMKGKDTQEFLDQEFVIQEIDRKEKSPRKLNEKERHQGISRAEQFER